MNPLLYIFGILLLISIYYICQTKEGYYKRMIDLKIKSYDIARPFSRILDDSYHKYSGHRYKHRRRYNFLSHKHHASYA